MKFLLFLLLTCTLNIEATIFNSKAIVHPEVGKNGMVVSQHYLATDAGHSILADGGNAYDASIAVAFALAVVLPRAGNIGGGGFMVMFDEASQESFSIDYREMAPEAATKDMFLSSDGLVDKKRATQGVLSIGVPGTVYGMWRKERAAAYKIDTDQLEEHYRKRSLLKKNVYPEDVAEALYFFASEDSSKSTGNIINIDAGHAPSFTR